MTDVGQELGLGTARGLSFLREFHRPLGCCRQVGVCGGEGLQISAPAPGRGGFAAPLTVRGNATIIDHGWGVYSGFWHQSQILVNVGDMVEQGQQIGVVGGTGRVTGAHLHWDLWVNGVQVGQANDGRIAAGKAGIVNIVSGLAVIYNDFTVAVLP